MASPDQPRDTTSLVRQYKQGEKDAAAGPGRPGPGPAVTTSSSPSYNISKFIKNEFTAAAAAEMLNLHGEYMVSMHSGRRLPVASLNKLLVTMMKTCVSCTHGPQSPAGTRRTGKVQVSSLCRRRAGSMVRPWLPPPATLTPGLAGTST